MRDFESYWAAGRARAADLQPYGRDLWRFQRTIPGVVATRDELLPFVGPPYGLPLWEPLGRLPFAVATWAWGAILGLSVATIALGSLRLAGRRIDAPDLLAAGAFCAGFGPLTSGTGLGQVAIVSCAAIVVAALTVRSGGALAVAAFVAALQPNLAIVLAATISRRRILPLALAALAALAIATLEPYGGMPAYFRLLAEHGAAERFIAIQTTVAAVLRGLSVGSGPAVLTGDAVALAVLGTLAVQCSRSWRPPAERLALACAALPLALPFSHEHDFTIVAIAAIYAVRRARGATFSLAAVATLVVAVDWIGLAQRPTGIAETVAFAIATAFALTVLAPRDDVADGTARGAGEAARATFRRSGALGVAALAAVLGPLAHHLPTWPDALSTTYRAGSTWTVTQVWFDEQARSGIAALDPWWAVLRALSLAGCALVWLAVTRVGADERATASRQPPDSHRRPTTPSSRPTRSSTLSTPPRPAAEAYPSS